MMKMLTNDRYKILNKMIVEVMDFPTKKMHCKSAGENKANVLPWIRTKQPLSIVLFYLVTSDTLVSTLFRCDFWILHEKMDPTMYNLTIVADLQVGTRFQGVHFWLFTPGSKKISPGISRWQKAGFASRYTLFSKNEIKFHMYFMVRLTEIPPDN